MSQTSQWQPRTSGLVRRTPPALTKIALCGGGTMLLSLMAAAFFYTVGPQGSAVQAPDQGRAAAAATKVRTLVPAAAAPTASLPGPTEIAAPTPPAPRREPAALEPAGQTVTVVRPGQVELTADQEVVLQNAGSGWGATSPEAQALIEAIPQAAFTTDW